MFDYRAIPSVPNIVPAHLRQIFEEADRLAIFIYSQTQTFLRDRVGPERLNPGVPEPNAQSIPTGMISEAARIAFHLALAYSNPGMSIVMNNNSTFP